MNNALKARLLAARAAHSTPPKQTTSFPPHSGGANHVRPSTTQNAANVGRNMPAVPIAQAIPMGMPAGSITAPALSAPNYLKKK